MENTPTNTSKQQLLLLLILFLILLLRADQAIRPGPARNVRDSPWNNIGDNSNCESHGFGQWSKKNQPKHGNPTVFWPCRCLSQNPWSTPRSWTYGRKGSKNCPDMYEHVVHKVRHPHPGFENPTWSPLCKDPLVFVWLNPSSSTISSCF